MRRTLPPLAFALFSLTASISLLAQDSPSIGLKGALSNPTPHHGETVSLEVTISNSGSVPVRELGIEILLESALMIGSETGLCSRMYDRVVRCSWPQAIDGGADATFSLDIRVSNSASAVEIRGAVITVRVDRDGGGGSQYFHPEGATLELTAPLSEAAHHSDVYVSLEHDPATPSLRERVALTATVGNSGPDPASDVTVIIEDRFRISHPEIKGADCEFRSPHFICRVPSLPSNSELTLEYEYTGAPVPEIWTRRAFVTFPDRTDRNPSDNTAEDRVSAGLQDTSLLLIPFVVQPTSGAFGSLWVSELSFHLDSSDSAAVFPLRDPCRIGCDSPFIITGTIPPGKTYEPSLLIAMDNPGYLLHIETRALPELAIVHRVRDVSRSDESLGTEIPVVHEGELLRERIVLIGIDTEQGFRRMLRIYDADTSGTTFSIRLFGNRFGEKRMVGELEVQPSSPPAYEANLGFPIHPGYAQIDLEKAFEDIDQYVDLRLEIEPRSPQTRYWTFLSITNNTTQQVTLVTPQQKPDPWSAGN